MKEIDIRRISFSNSKFVTRLGKSVKFLNYIPETNPQNRLLFLFNGNILGCDEMGKCHTVNSYDNSYTETNFTNFDIFVDDLIRGYINIYEKDFGYVSEGIYTSIEEAKSKINNDRYIKTIEIEFSIETEVKNESKEE